MKKSKKLKKCLSTLLLSCLLIFSFTLQTLAAPISPQITDPGDGIELYVFSMSSGTSSSSTSGHSWIYVDNGTPYSLTVGVISVAPGSGVTVGTWGNKPAHSGIWYNLESYFCSTAPSSFNGRSSLHLHLSSISTINSYISSHDSWSILNNCSSFASGAWNSVSSTQISAGLINTPTNLQNYIKSKSGYDTNAYMPAYTQYGYKLNGVFFAPSSYN
jgi:hypothetical protein